MSFVDDRHDPHADLAAYAIGGLEAAEQAQFEAHLASCAACRTELGAFTQLAGLLEDSAPPPALPEGLERRTLAAVERAAAEHGEVEAFAPATQRAAEPHAVPPRRRSLGEALGWRRRAGLAAAGVVAVAVVLAVGIRIGEGGEGGAPSVSASAEFTALLTGESGGADVRVSELGIGRSIVLRTDDLAVLDNTEEFYELWFVGAGDTAEDPDRVSAGTFHPDDEGRTSVRLTAAVKPRDYPSLSVTREPRDGDPSRTGPEVLTQEQRESLD